MYVAAWGLILCCYICAAAFCWDCTQLHVPSTQWWCCHGPLPVAEWRLGATITESGSSWRQNVHWCFRAWLQVQTTCNAHICSISMHIKSRRIYLFCSVFPSAWRSPYQILARMKDWFFLSFFFFSVAFCRCILYQMGAPWHRLYTVMTRIAPRSRWCTRPMPHHSHRWTPLNTPWSISTLWMALR